MYLHILHDRTTAALVKSGFVDVVSGVGSDLPPATMSEVMAVANRVMAAAAHSRSRDLTTPLMCRPQHSDAGGGGGDVQHPSSAAADTVKRMVDCQMAHACEPPKRPLLPRGTTHSLFDGRRSSGGGVNSACLPVNDVPSVATAPYHSSRATSIIALTCAAPAAVP